MLVCKPIGICSSNYKIEGQSISADLKFNVWSEQGQIILNGEHFDVAKQGPFSGLWSMTGAGNSTIVAEKSFTRKFNISSGGETYRLYAESALLRKMVLDGPETNCYIEPTHSLTRRAKITGRWEDDRLVCFSFWLVAMTWRRASSSGTAAGSAAAAGGGS